MKTIIKKSLFLGAVAVGMVSCNENSWNDTYLDGFEGGQDLSNVQTLEYTFTDDDYKNLADNSANKNLAAAAGVSNELKAVGSLHYFNGQIQPVDYMPNFLADPDFAYFTLSEGSAINVTYKIAKDLPAEMVGMNAASTYNVTTADYQEAYGSEENYAESFSPTAPATGNIPRILKANFPDAESGDYVVVNYNNSETAPVFSAPEESTFEMSDVLKAGLKENDPISVAGVVTGICAQGFIVSDKAGSILVYFGKSYDNSYKVGDQLEIEGTVDVYNNGLQIKDDCTIKKVGEAKEIPYPTPKVYTGADMDAALQPTTDFLAVYCSVTGKVTVSGNYYNFEVAGATAATGSFYQLTDSQKAMLVDGNEYVISGYFISVSKSGGVPKFFNLLLTGVQPVTKSVNRGPRRIAQIANTATSALYLFDGSKWAVVSDVTVLQPADYAQMGVNGALTENQAAVMIPQFLAKTYPYAAAETKKYVLYSFKNGNEIDLRSVEYMYDGEKWIDSISHEGVITETNQFVFKGGAWKMDPSIELVLPAGKNKPTSTWFYQAVVDWVSANIPNAENFVDSYGTAEYYSGCSSYQGNVNINTGYGAISGNSDYAGKTPEEIETIMKKRFETETGPGTLSVLYPNMAPIGDFEPTVTIEFTAWTTGGINKVYTIVFKCVEKGKFEFVSCTWNDPEAE